MPANVNLQEVLKRILKLFCFQLGVVAFDEVDRAHHTVNIILESFGIMRCQGEEK